MATLDIITYPDPLLKKVSKPLKELTTDQGSSIEVSSEYKKLASDMLETMYKAPGIGLSAIQVGVEIRLIVIDIRMTENTESNDQSKHSVDSQHMTELEKQISYPLIMFNPRIVKRKDKTSYQEGCLSVPGIFETVERSTYIEAQGFNQEGQFFEVKTDGILSICIQHEIDHLDGKLFIDRLSFLKADVIRSQIMKLKRNQQQDQAQIL